MIATMPKEQFTATAAALIRSALGGVTEVTALRVIQEDKDYAVLALTLSNPEREIVVKLAGPHARLACPFDRTAAIVGLIRSRTAAPTFEVLAFDVSYRVCPWRYMVMSSVPGANWLERRPGQARAHGAALGRTVGQLHTLRFPSCGEVGTDGHPIEGTTYFAALLVRVRRRIVNTEHASLIISLLQERVELFAGLDTGALCHEDLNPYNLLVDDTYSERPIVSVVDFDSAWAGCPESDLARLELWRGIVGEGFWEAYRAVAPLSPRYAERRPLYQLLWCLEYARPTREHLEDTAAICAELGIAPVTFS